MAKEKDVTLKLKLKPATAADLDKAFSSIKSSVKSFTSKIAGALGVSLAAGGVVGAVQKASPATVTRMTYAFDDMIATVGHALIPVIELLTDAFRLVGDVLTSILPSADEVRDALSPFKDFLDDLRDIFAELAPLFKDFLELGLKGLKLALQASLVPLQLLVNTLKALGLIGNTKLKSSVGAAARPIEFTSQDQAAKEIYKAAYLASQNTPAGKPVKSAEQIWQDLDKNVEEIVNRVKEIVTALAKGVGAGQSVAEAIGAVVAGAIGGVR